MREGIEASLRTAQQVLEAYLADPRNLDDAERIAQEIVRCLREGHKIMIAGNGGSMADALHFAEEWTGRFRKERKPYPVMALGESTHLTCVANDYGFEHVFSRMVEAFGRPGDLLILLSTSGNSHNLVAAATKARAQNVKVIGFLGRGGGNLLADCDLCLMAPGETSDRIQEIHMLMLHILIEVAERELGHR